MGRGPPNAAPRATSRSPRSAPTASPPPGTRPVRPDSSPYSLRSGPTMNSTVIEVEGLRKEYRRVRGGRTLPVDEPANGLDPAGIKEVRDLVRRLGSQGRTVFVSSHQLAEVQQMCDRVAILSRGRLVAMGRVAEVLARGRREALIVKLRELEAGLGALRAAGLEASMEDGMLRVHLPASEGARVTEILASRGMFVSELRPEEVSLEDVFLELTQGPSPGQDHVAG